jgi:hypothetical protein
VKDELAEDVGSVFRWTGSWAIFCLNQDIYSLLADETAIARTWVALFRDHGAGNQIKAALVVMGRWWWHLLVGLWATKGLEQVSRVVDQPVRRYWYAVRIDDQIDVHLDRGLDTAGDRGWAWALTRRFPRIQLTNGRKPRLRMGRGGHRVSHSVCLIDPALHDMQGCPAGRALCE